MSAFRFLWVTAAFDLRIAMKVNGPVREYARTLDFSNGLASVRWQDDTGA